MHLGNRRDHRVFVNRLGLSAHQLRPYPESRSVHRDNVVRTGHPCQPRLKLGSLAGVLLTGDFNAGLILADRYSCKMQLQVVDAL